MPPIGRKYDSKHVKSSRGAPTGDLDKFLNFCFAPVGHLASEQAPASTGLRSLTVGARSHTVEEARWSVRSEEKKSEKISKSRGRPSSRCRRVLRRRGCPAPSRSRFPSDRRKKKVKNFLSPVAGQVVDVGASWAGRLPCSESMSRIFR